jgi:hypothetical protein
MAGMRFAAGTLAALAFPLLVTCAGGDDLPDDGPPPPLLDPLLSLDPGAAASANAAALPPGFAGPMETVCAADTTRGFLAELIDHLDDPQVIYEWAPINPAAGAPLPVIGQAGMFASGTVTGIERSGLDFRPAHPFGFDTTWDFVVDLPFRFVVHNRPGDSNDGDAIHAEIERGLFPDETFGFTPAPGDRVLVQGDWIFDCGHPPYEAELHPPAFLAFGRSDGHTTTSIAFANPYRNTQLYGSVALVDRFDLARFQDPSVAPFPGSLTNQVILAAAGRIDRFELHALVEALRFDPVTWFVCAPGPRPSPDAMLGARYRFVARSGVSVRVARRGDSGCLAVHAEAGPGYTPAVPARADYAWSWAQINAEASSQVGTAIDIRQTIINALTMRGFTGAADVPALQPDVAPILDTYPPLAPRPGASPAAALSQRQLLPADTPSEIVSSADDQPFPFYGWVTVAWE